jgi:hypothetical protein
MSSCCQLEVNEMVVDARSSIPLPARDLLTRQTGQILVELGNMLANVPEFSENMDKGTAELLISLGNKLRRK